MQLNLKKALFLSYLLTVALSCEAVPGDLNATATPPPCNGISGAAECLIAYQQPALELITSSDDFEINKALMAEDPTCSRGPGKPYRGCVPPPSLKPHCGDYTRDCHLH